MPSAKSGKAGSAVSPTAPKSAEEADKANPGEVEKVKAEQIKTKTGKYGSEKVKPYKPPQTKEEMETKKSWIEIEMVGEDDLPIIGAVYRTTLSDDPLLKESQMKRALLASKALSLERAK